MHEKFNSIAAVVLSATFMSLSGPVVAATVQIPQLQPSQQLRPQIAPKVPPAVLVSQQTPVPLRWPEFAREPEPRPLPQQGQRNYPGSTLGNSAYGRSPGGGTTTTHHIWPRSGRIYPPPYNHPSPPEPLRWPEYQR